MTVKMPVTLFYLGGALALAILIGILAVRFMSRKRGVISRSLNLSLLAVRMPPVRLEPMQSGVQQIRERIALMEQLYGNLHQIRDSFLRNFFYGRPVFALELTVPHIGEEMSFYLAVPRRLAPSVEKVVQGIFPDADVAVAPEYNIFSPTGASAGAYLKLGRNRYYPLRTYQKLEGDPMREITNVFTKLARQGEGAALQIVARPARHKWQRKLKAHAKLLFEGKRPTHGVVRAVEMISETVASPAASSPEAQQKKMESQKRITPMEEEIVRGIENKASKTLFETTIRLVTSAASQDRADAILQGLELAFSQFTDANSNNFIAERVGVRGFKSFAFDFSFRAYATAKTAVLGSEELTSIFHFPNVPTDTPQIKILKAREAAPPPNLPSEGLLLGYNAFRGDKRDIRMLDEDRRRHLYVIGQTGTGKTTFIENLAVQDIQAGKGV